MGWKTKVFILTPLAILAIIVMGIAMYNTFCKNSNFDFFGC
jgi:hypothetical protein